jgi:hypothetical protein
MTSRSERRFGALTRHRASQRLYANSAAGVAAGKLAENSDALARKPATASVLIWRYGEVVRTLGNTLTSESSVGAERHREFLRPVEAPGALA